MDGLKEIIILSEMSDRERKISYHLYVESKKWYKGTYKAETDSQT